MPMLSRDELGYAGYYEHFLWRLAAPIVDMTRCTTVHVMLDEQNNFLQFVCPSQRCWMLPFESGGYIILRIARYCGWEWNAAPPGAGTPNSRYSRGVGRRWKCWVVPSWAIRCVREKGICGV